MTSVKRVIKRSKKATKKLSKRRSKKRVTALKSKSKRHTRRNKSKHHGGVGERASVKKAVTAMRASPNPTSNIEGKQCRKSESKAAIISYINRLIIEHEAAIEVKGDRKELLSDKPMPSIMRSLSRLSVDDIIGSVEGTGMGMSYADILKRFKLWRNSEAERRRELRSSKRAGVSPRATSSSRSRKTKDSSNDSDEAYNAAMTILSLQEEREIDTEIDDDALRDMQVCEDYTDPPPTITTIPPGFTPVKKNVSVSSIEPIVNNPKPSALFGRPKKNDDDSDADLDNFMNDIDDERY